MNARAARVVLPSLVLIGAAVWALLAPREMWPLTSGPMFAYYHAPGDPLYEFAFYEERDAGEVELGASDFGTLEQSFMRWFFGSFYGSVDPQNPNAARGARDPESFRARMGDFCQRMLAMRQRRTGAAAPIRVELYELSGARRRLAAVVGRCERAGGFSVLR